MKTDYLPNESDISQNNLTGGSNHDSDENQGQTYQKPGNYESDQNKRNCLSDQRPGPPAMTHVQINNGQQPNTENYSPANYNRNLQQTTTSENTNYVVNVKKEENVIVVPVLIQKKPTPPQPVVVVPVKPVKILPPLGPGEKRITLVYPPWNICDSQKRCKCESEQKQGTPCTLVCFVILCVLSWFGYIMVCYVLVAVLIILLICKCICYWD